MRRVGRFLSLLVFLGLSASVLAVTTSMEWRIAAQQALDRVAFEHLVIPQGTAGATMSFEQAYPADAIQRKVEKTLIESKALDVYWHRPITGEQLQAEIDRMVKGTRDPRVLKEMFAALGNDPAVIAENLARPLLADRLCRQWYARDDRFHGDLKAKALAELKGLTAETLRSTDGQYSEYEIKENTSGKPAAGPGQFGLLDPPQWKESLSRLAQVLNVEISLSAGDLPVGRISGLQEDDTRFYALGILKAKPHSVKVALVQWPKVSFDAWLNKQRQALGVQEPAPVSYDFHLAPMPEASSGANDTWSPMTQVPQERQNPISVWTGTEMIVWGGVEGMVFFNTGGRYDPATDTWTLMSTVNAPAGRMLASAVWTGTRMLVWGGGASSFMTTGGLYDPATDTWTSIADSSGIVSGRTYCSTVWTGTEMIAWGGYNSSGVLNDGGAYDPSTDKWRALSAPTVVTSSGPKTLEPRYGHVGVWTGSKMIVWGGLDQNYTPDYWKDGMMYDPSADSWSLINPNAPQAGGFATAVWTGKQMIVWGGDNGGVVQNIGMLYDPVADSWTTTSMSGAPAPREMHFAWWTGSAMLIWGGQGSNGLLTNGGQYTPGSDSWQSISTLNAPATHYYSTSVWTGTEMIVWGGAWAGTVGGRYNPVTDSWASTNSYDIPSARRFYAEVWTGTEVLVWGGDDTTNTPVTGPGGRYNPATDSWAAMSTVNSPIPRRWSMATFNGVWTGKSMIVWGGFTDVGGTTATNTGGIYNVASDTWTPTSVTGAPDGTVNGSIVWTGSEMIVWGGYDPILGGPTNAGGLYDPGTDSWTPTSTTNALLKMSHSTVWTGTKMIVWGGLDNKSMVTGTGQLYDPSTDTWADVTTTGAPDARYYHTAVWTGDRMIIFGGATGMGAPVVPGASYDPATDTWTPISTTNAPIGTAYGNMAVWTGHEMVIWGGVQWGTGNLLNSGARYRPSGDVWEPMSNVGAPTPRRDIPGVFTGSALVVWGGMTDGDASCSGGRYWMTSGPVVTGINPSVGPVAGGTSVIISGTALGGATSVSFGGVAAQSITINSDTQVTAVSPAASAGTVDVVVTTLDGTSATGPADEFTYTSMPVLNLQSDSFTDACVVGSTGSGDGYIDPGEDVTLSVTLANTGTGDATGVQAILSTTTGGVYVSTATAAFPDIHYGGTGSAAFPYVFHVDTSHTCGDTLDFQLLITANEGTWTSVFTLPVGHYGTAPTIDVFSENFDGSGGVLPTGWATETLQGSAWAVAGGGPVCSSPWSLQYYCSTTVAADAWAYTPAQVLTPGVTYTLSFSEKVTIRKTHNLAVWLGSAQSSAAMTTMIWSSSLTNTACATKSITFTVPSSGTYYLGFHEISNPFMYYLTIDDLALTYQGPPPCLSSSCGSAAPAITTQPTNQSACVNASVSFTAAASGVPTPTVQWQVSVDGGGTWSDVAGATSDTLTFTAQGSQNGYQYRAVYTSNSGAATTSAATLTANGVPVVTTQPTDQSACPNTSVVFTAAASGSPSIQWQVSTDGGVGWSDVAGATSATLTFTSQSSQNGYQYHAVFTNTCGTGTSNPATLSINGTPAVTTQPSSQTACSGNSVSFTAAASGSPTIQWQVSTDGGASWSDVLGATAGTLSFMVQSAQNGYEYHAVFTTPCATATSNAATLTVNTSPVVTTQPSSQAVAPGQSVSFTAAASGTPVPTIQWQVSTDGGLSFADLSGETSSTLTFSAVVSENGNEYRALFTNGCGSLPSSAATLTVTCPQISMTPQAGALPGGMLNAPYPAVSFTADGGTPTYSFSTPSVDLPPGLTLSAAGMLSGTPTSAGDYTFTVTVTDDYSCTGSATYTLSILAYDLHFADDYGRSLMCANSHTGLWSYEVLKGNGAGRTFTGTGTIQAGSGYLRLVGSPGSGMALNLTYYTNAHRATASFTDRSAAVSSALYDSNTQDDPTTCGGGNE